MSTPKPTRAWAVIWDERLGGGPAAHYGGYAVFARRETARAVKKWKGQRVIPVLITPLEGTDLKGRAPVESESKSLPPRIKGLKGMESK